MLLNIVNKRDDYINRKIIRRAMINDDSSINIPKSLNDFSDNGSRKAAGYYEKNNYINQSDSVSIVSSEFNNEEDENLNINQQLPWPKTGNINRNLIIQSLLAILKVQIIYYIKIY